jgi:succinate dehydrogenase/fumarate reductase-like Fe-S protein
MNTFPVIRDLQVDRSRMFDNLKRMKAWIPIDGTFHKLFDVFSLAYVVPDLNHTFHQLGSMLSYVLSYVIRDLQVDRSRMFDNLKRMKAWIPIDGTYDLGPGPRMPEKKRQTAYELSKCMTCGELGSMLSYVLSYRTF